jgi:hypothetical protein
MAWARRVAVAAVVIVAACQRSDHPRFTAYAQTDTPEPTAGKHTVEIVHPAGLGVVDSEQHDARGQRVGIACGTCHADGDAGALARRDGHPRAVHAQLALQHGGLDCASCHRRDAPGDLVLANGEIVPMHDYMRLCAQCHGPQYRDYVHGSHGGMKGYWDLRRGPRQRNSCIACHVPHEPAYPQVIPAPGPVDRFLAPKHEAGAAYERRFTQDMGK